MKLIVGLGNPGRQYARTRHNVGWMLLEELLANFKAQNSSVDVYLKPLTKFEAEVAKFGDTLVAKPLTYMNLSGRAVQKIMTYHHVDPSDLYVLHDDLDLTWGTYKFQQGKGPKIHGGINSIEQTLGTKGFWRVRLGVDNRTSEERTQIPGRNYVLKTLTIEELDQLDDMFKRLAQELIDQIELKA